MKRYPRWLTVVLLLALLPLGIRYCYPRLGASLGWIDNIGNSVVEPPLIQDTYAVQTPSVETHYPAISSVLKSTDAQNVELVGHFGGAILAVFAAGDYAYVGEGPRLTILDASNPSALTVMGKTPPLSGRTIRAICVSGNYAYVVNQVGGLRIVDVSIPTAPMEIGYYEVGDAWDVAVAGNYAYIAAGFGGLRLVDVSTPATPVEIGVYDIPHYARGVEVVGNIVYVADAEGSLRIVDVSNPVIPIEIGAYVTPGQAFDVAVIGNYAYIAAGFSGLRVVDISTPTAPLEVGFYSTSDQMWDVVVNGNYAYVVGNLGGLRIVDVSIPTVPVEVGCYEAVVGTGEVAVVGNYVYVAAAYNGDDLRIVDVSIPTAPVEVGRYEAGRGEALGIAGNYVYTTDYWQTLRVVDVSNPTAPVELVSHNILGPGYAAGVVVEGNYAYITMFSNIYVGDPPGNLWIVDVSSPEAPVEVGFYEVALLSDVVVVGNYAYVASYEGLRVIDVSTPSTPVEVGYYEMVWATSIAVNGDYAYVTSGYGDLRIVNVSTPSTPVEVGIYVTSGQTQGVAVSGNYVYVGHVYDGSLRIVDVSTPSVPVEVGRFEVLNVNDIAVAGNYAYVASTGLDTIKVVDVSIPELPVEVGRYDVGESASDVAVAGNYIYVAAGLDGVFILRYTGGGGLVPAPFLSSPCGSSCVVTAYFDHCYPTYRDTPNCCSADPLKYMCPYWAADSKHNAWYPDADWSFQCDQPDIRQCSWYSGHDGYDYAGFSTVVAADAGQVAYVGCAVPSQTYPCPGSYGLVVDIDHQNGYLTRYGHLNETSVVSGALVSAGQQIGLVGSTGNSKGPHLHFLVYEDVDNNGQVDSVDKPVDPFGPNPPQGDLWRAYVTGTPSYWLWTDSPPTSGSLTPAVGGGLTAPDGDVAITVPAGAVMADTILYYTVVPEPPYIRVGASGVPAIRASGMTAVSTGHTFSLSASDETGNPVDTLLALAAVTVTFSDSDLTYVNSDTLGIYLWDESDSDWMLLPSNLDPTCRTVSTTLAALGIYSLRGQASNPAPTIFAIDPIMGDNTIDTQITISGTNFLPIPFVRIGEWYLPNVHFVSTSTLTATIPAGLDVGTYDVMVENPDRQEAILSDAFSVTEASPVADLAASPLSGTAPLTVVFTDTSSGVIAVWLWAFGDGVTDTVQHPTHVYPTPGQYTVTLMVTGPGGVDTLVRPAYIHVTKPATSCVPLTSVGIVGPLGVTGMLYISTPYTFHAIITPTTATAPITYTWMPEPLSGQATLTTTYQWATPGACTVTLRAENCGGPVTVMRVLIIQGYGETLVYLPLVLRQS